MKKIILLGMGLCIALSFSSCKSSESAYKKAYEKAKQQELAESTNNDSDEEIAAPVEAAPVPAAPEGSVREEKVELVSGTGLRAYSVVCGSFGIKANADGLKERLDGDGYEAKVVYSTDSSTYRVIVSSYDTYSEAASARDAFKSRYPSNSDFQKSWLLYAK